MSGYPHRMLKGISLCLDSWSVWAEWNGHERLATFIGWFADHCGYDDPQS